MRRPLRTGLALGVAAAVVVGAMSFVGGLADVLGNPFRSERHERVDPAVISALADADELRAATADVQVVVEVEDDTRFLPDALAGQQTTFLAAGTADAAVDLGDAVVTVGRDGRIVVSVPAPRLDRVAIDTERTRILDRDRGLFNRIGDALTDNPDDDADLYRLAERELRRSATETELLARAESSARATIQRILADAGATDVDIDVVFRGAEVGEL